MQVLGCGDLLAKDPILESQMSLGAQQRCKCPSHYSQPLDHAPEPNRCLPDNAIEPTETHKQERQRKRFNADPAVASGPVLTTVTDMCGFFLVLGLATVALPWLTGITSSADVLAAKPPQLQTYLLTGLSGAARQGHFVRER